MSWVIAILLILILVALMASDKSAAVAVKRVLRISLLGVVLLGATLAIALFFVWFHLGFANEDWWQTGAALMFFFFWAFGAWVVRKEIVATYRNDRRGSVLVAAKALAAVGLLLLTVYVLKRTLEEFQLSGWWLVAGALACVFQRSRTPVSA